MLIVDYGIGNLLSISRAVKKAGGNPIISSEPDQIITARRAILPGVGAFGDCIVEIKRRGLYDPLLTSLRNEQQAWLGICVGMQMLTNKSFEFGEHQGFQVIPGEVHKIPNMENDVFIRKLPHVGWNKLLLKNETMWEGGIFKGIKPNSAFYFVHSYSVRSEEKDNILAYAEHDGYVFTAAIQSSNTFGVQFHPEKSGTVGIQVLQNFINLDINSP
ncbi:imidazole glycerol phosphate synthase subunit HisH [Terasakiella sp. SH-1]|uniref:imidazole glycerol phosphate synthase subunit HisH n=1 Tax=Terasakiella sp. SH-1 TaxID=2560057 RepID=UPI00142FE561|nr:imidazole glycerol phosphate synthase subunit HisH [Terasakiella sp. SH-1]